MFIRNKILILLGVVFVFSTSSAKYYSVKSKDKFYDKLTSKYGSIELQYKMAIASINLKPEKGLKKDDRELYEKLKDMKDIFRDAEKGNKNVRFIYANLKPDDYFSLINELKVRKYINKEERYLPVFILFRLGKIVLDKAKMPIIKVGFLSRYDIDNLILNNFGNEISQIKKSKKEERIRREELNALSWRPYAYPYWGWYYPGWRWRRWYWRY